MTAIQKKSTMKMEQNKMKIHKDKIILILITLLYQKMRKKQLRKYSKKRKKQKMKKNKKKYIKTTKNLNYVEERIKSSMYVKISMSLQLSLRHFSTEFTLFLLQPNTTKNMNLIKSQQSQSPLNLFMIEKLLNNSIISHLIILIISLLHLYKITFLLTMMNISILSMSKKINLAKI